MILQAALGFFAMEISLFMINVPHDSIENVSPFAEGAFGKVALIECDKKRLVAKFIKMKNNFNLKRDGVLNILR